MSLTNECRFIGNLTKNPEGRDVKVGGEAKRVLTFSIAVNTYRVAKDREQPAPVYVDLEVWDKAAQVIENNLVKGDRILAIGEMKVDVYEKDGETKYRTKFNVRDFEILKAKKWADAKPKAEDEAEAPAPKKDKAKPKKTKPAPEPEPEDDDEDDDDESSIPF